MLVGKRGDPSDSEQHGTRSFLGETGEVLLPTLHAKALEKGSANGHMPWDTVILVRVCCDPFPVLSPI